MDKLALHLLKSNSKYDRGYSCENIYYLIDYVFEGKKVSYFLYSDIISYLLEYRVGYGKKRKRSLNTNDTLWQPLLDNYLKNADMLDEQVSLFDFFMWKKKTHHIEPKKFAQHVWIIIQSFKNGNSVGPAHVDLIIKFLLYKQNLYYG